MKAAQLIEITAICLAALISPALADNEFFIRGNWQDPGIEYRVKMQPVHEGDVIGELYLPLNANPAPALLALGACTKESLRGLAQGMADHGYATLALFYCGPDTPRAQLQEIPLEVFKHALDWLKEQPEVDKSRVGLIGESAGGAAALLTAATYPESNINAVVAVVPGSVVWQAPIVGGEPKSMFSLSGKPLPFIPGDISLPTDVRIAESKKVLLNPPQGTIIPIEKAKAPILLLAAQDDRSWPSAEMADQIAAILHEKNPSLPIEKVDYGDAGHGFFAAHDSVDPWFAEIYPRLMDSAIDKQLGGTTEGNEAAQKDAWIKTLSFLHHYL